MQPILDEIKMGVNATIVLGSFVHSISSTVLELIEEGMLLFDTSGTIIGIAKQRLATEQWETRDGVRDAVLQRGWLDRETLDDLTSLRLVRLRKGEFILPGLIDTHTHAVQYANAGVGQQYELLDWLKNVTFAEEQKFGCDEYARRMFEKVVRRTLNTGTTTSCYFSSLHLSSAKVLAKVCYEFGQRAFIGKCNMDRNEAFEEYKEASVEESINDTQQLIDFIRQECPPQPTNEIQTTPSPTVSCTSSSNQSMAITDDVIPIKPLKRTEDHELSLVQPILTPRFAISCTDELLSRLGSLLQGDPSLRLQTHLSESRFEIEHTKSLFPGCKTYAEIYDRFKLLNQRTILAHCIHLEPCEIELIVRRGSGLSHCPNSNLNLKSGICQVKSLLNQGVEKIGMGTDVSGGFGVGLLSSIRDGMMAGKALGFHHVTSTHQAREPLSIENLFYMATLGGARVCNLEDRIGNFEVGKEFDAIFIQTGAHQGQSQDRGSGELPFSLNPYKDGTNPLFFLDELDSGLDLACLFEKFLFTGDDRNIGSVFVKGKVVGGARRI